MYLPPVLLPVSFIILFCYSVSTISGPAGRLIKDYLDPA